MTNNNELLPKVRHIFETESSREAEDYLCAGWILLDSYKTCYDPQLFPNHQTLHLVLVWAKDEEPIYPEKEFRPYRG